jgi:hypothetical protein
MSNRRQQLLPNRPHVIVFDEYENSAEGPTIRVDIQSASRLRELEAIFSKLAVGDLHQIALSTLPDGHWVPPLREMFLAVSSHSEVVMSGTNDSGFVCNWTETLEGWLESAEKVAAMAESQRSCHQYFDGLGHNNVTVQVAYLE